MHIHTRVRRRLEAACWALVGVILLVVGLSIRACDVGF